MKLAGFAGSYRRSIYRAASILRQRRKA